MTAFASRVFILDRECEPVALRALEVAGTLDADAGRAGTGEVPTA